MNLLDKVMREGRPFKIEIETDTDSAIVKIADLDNYVPPGYDEAVFKDKMLWLSALKIEANGNTIEFVKLDNNFIHSGGDLDLSDGVSGRFGGLIPVRNLISIKNSGTPSGSSVITLWGLYTQRDM